MICFYTMRGHEIVFGTTRHSFPVHIHQSDCFGMILAGRVRFCSGARQSVLCCGEGYFIPHGEPHAFYPVGGAPYSYATFCVAPTADNRYDASPLRTAAEFIRSRSDADFDLQSLCAFAHLSKYHLVRSFKREFDLTPYQYYQNARIRQVRHGLAQNRQPADLSYSLGFSSQSHMCNLFKKYMGVTPGQYRAFYSSAGEKTARM